MSVWKVAVVALLLAAIAGVLQMKAAARIQAATGTANGTTHSGGG